MLATLPVETIIDKIGWEYFEREDRHGDKKAVGRFLLSAAIVFNVYKGVGKSKREYTELFRRRFNLPSIVVTPNP